MTLAAQGGAPQGPPPGGPLTGMFRNATLGRQRNLAQAFDSIPESKFGYKPTPLQQTIGFIAQHLSNDNYIFCNAFGPKKDARSEEEKTTPDSVKATWPKAKLMTNLKASFAFCEEAFAQIDDAKLLEMSEMVFGGQARPALRANAVLLHVTDMADHYSQISNYMRLNGMLPPSALPRPPRAP
jgi:uncharacterized damage-inducible protein DinB